MNDPLSARELAAFAAAVETGSVQGAAEALNLTQSAATKRIQALEARLGTTLLVRDRTGASPTDEGGALYPHARRALDALVDAERAVSAGREAQPLRLAASHTIGECLLPGWLADFRAQTPDLHPQVDVVNSPAAIAALRKQAADVGFVEGLDPLDGLDVCVVAHDELAVVVAADHPWAGRRAIRPADLGRERYVARESGSGTRAVAEARLAEVGVRLEPELTLASLGGVKRSLAGGGFALISRLSLGPESAGSLRAVPIADLRIERALVAVRPEGSRSRAGRCFWDWLNSRSE